MTDLFIIGSGGHARDLAEIALALDLAPVFVIRDESERAAFRSDQAAMLEADALAQEDAQFAIGVGDNRTRAEVARRLGNGRSFPALIHPDSTIGRSSLEALRRSHGTVVFPGVRVMGNCTIGDFCTLNLNATVSHDCRIGDFANLSPGAHLAGNVELEEGAWVGMGVTVNQGSDAEPRRIGAWSTVGSGAAVVRDVPPGITQVGIPAREITR